VTVFVYEIAKKCSHAYWTPGRVTAIQVPVHEIWLL